MEEQQPTGGGHHPPRLCDCGRPLANGTRLSGGAREATARRALELSLSPDGGTSDENWLRAVHELGAQYGRYP